MKLNPIYKEACEIIVSAGGTPVPVTETLVTIVQKLIDPEDIELVFAFKELRSQTMEQLIENTTMGEAELLEKLTQLAGKGVIFNQPNRKGVVVYRLLPFLNVGFFEYNFMRKVKHSEANKELANLFQMMFGEIRAEIQLSFDDIVASMDQMPPIDRTIPIRQNRATGNIVIEIDRTLEEPVEKALTTEYVADLIEKFDEIAVGHCFCRQHKDLLGQPCSQTDVRENCFTFGKSARFTSEQGFMRLIDRNMALDILSRAESDGLVHKAYHANFDLNKDETSVCNCCSCCCGNSIKHHISPIINATNFLAAVSTEKCSGCELCAAHCHTEAIALSDQSVSEVDPERCLGCGICAYFCPEDAIRLHESNRIVRIAPPRNRT